MQITQEQFNALTPEMQTALQQQGVQVINAPTNIQQPQPQQMMPGNFGGGWGIQPTHTSEGWVSVGVPVTVETEIGECTVYLNFVGLETPGQVSGLVKGLIAKGFPVKAWKKKNGKW